MSKSLNFLVFHLYNTVHLWDAEYCTSNLKYVHAFISRASESVTFYGRENIADVVKLKTSRDEEVILDYLGGFQVILEVLKSIWCFWAVLRERTRDGIMRRTQPTIVGRPHKPRNGCVL